MTEKTPLVLLPAFMSTATLWRPQVAALADMAEVNVVDLTPYDSITRMADAVLDQAPDQFALAGLSLGGFTAFEIMRRAPERVARLALISTSAQGDSAERFAARKQQIAAVQAGQFADIVEGFLKVLQSPAHPWSSDVLETVRQMIDEAGPDCFLRQQNAMMNRVDQRSSLSAISCPTTVIHARDDQSWLLENGEELARLIPGARLQVIDNCGHFPTLDQPERMTEIMRAWLGR